MNSSASGPDNLRLQVFLSRSGVCSRREAMKLVQSGRVSVNGRVNKEPSTKVDPAKDEIKLDGKTVASKDFQYILLNKPAGYMTTKRDPHAERTVYDLLPSGWQHLKAVGRLDKDTEGLLLFTNDGELANRMTHPRFLVRKQYFVIIDGELTDTQARKLEKGVIINGEKTSPARIKVLERSKKKTQLQMEIREGKKRQVRLMFETVAQRVIYLKRVAQGPLRLGALKEGKWRTLDKEEITELKKI